MMLMMIMMIVIIMMKPVKFNFLITRATYT